MDLRPSMTLLMAAALLGGCVVVPTPARVPAPKAAAIARIELVVPQPNAGRRKRLSAVDRVPWNAARLTIAPLDHPGAPLTHLLEAHSSGLVPVDPFQPLAPGRYQVRAELLEELPSGAQRIVATGLLDGDSAAQLALGPNDLHLMVHPTQPGTHVDPAPTPLVDDDDDGHRDASPVTVSTGTDDAGAALVQALLTSSYGRGDASRSDGDSGSADAASGDDGGTGDTGDSSNDDSNSSSDDSDSSSDDSDKNS